jgi:hypothetical protein
MLEPTSKGVIRDLQAQGVAIYDNSMLSACITCPRLLYYRHQRGLVPKNQQPSTPLQFGLAVHASLETYYGGSTEHEALKVFVEIFKPFEEMATISPKTGKELGATYTVLYGCSILSEYFRKYKSDAREIIMLETPVAEEISDGVFLAGRIDKVVKGRSGVVFVDYKTSKYIDGFQLNPNPQFMTYKFLTEKLTGEKVSGELDLIGVSKTKDVSLLLRREPFNYTKYQMDEWRKSVIGNVKTLEFYKANNFFPQTWRCKPFYRDCAFLPLCTLPEDGMVERFIEEMYEISYWDPFAEEGD